MFTPPRATPTDTTRISTTAIHTERELFAISTSRTGGRGGRRDPDRAGKMGLLCLPYLRSLASPAGQRWLLALSGAIMLGLLSAWMS